jgi:hypothetical protein
VTSELPDQPPRKVLITEGDEPSPPVTSSGQPIPEEAMVSTDITNESTEQSEQPLTEPGTSLDDLTVEELDALAEERGIENYPKSANKAEKIAAIESEGR